MFQQENWKGRESEKRRRRNEFHNFLPQEMTP
jgi:hypothetical protein